MEFVLEPFYKLFSVTISNEKPELVRVYQELGIHLNKKDFNLDIKPLLQLVVG